MVCRCVADEDEHLHVDSQQRFNGVADHLDVGLHPTVGPLEEALLRNGLLPRRAAA